MSSDKQIAANQQNALRSTGPRTIAGKRRSSRNALRHGLTAITVVLPLENANDYRLFERSLLKEFGASSPAERYLVCRLASLWWRLNRATQIETELFEIQAEALPEIKWRNIFPSESKGTNILTSIFRNCGTTEENNLESIVSPGRESGSQAASKQQGAFDRRRSMASSFLRLCNLNGHTQDRVARYEATLSRQALRTLAHLAALKLAKTDHKRR